MSFRISLTLEASEMFSFLHMSFILERAAVVWAIQERTLGFEPSLEMITPRYLKFSTSSSIWPFILISLWKPYGLFIIALVLSASISVWYLVVVVSRRPTRTPASSSSLHLRQCHLQSGSWWCRPPILTLPSWSSNASHMILSRKMLKRVGESRHPCSLSDNPLGTKFLCQQKGLITLPIRCKFQKLFKDWFYIVFFFFFFFFFSCFTHVYRPRESTDNPCQQKGFITLPM